MYFKRWDEDWTTATYLPKVVLSYTSTIVVLTYTKYSHEISVTNLFHIQATQNTEEKAPREKQNFTPFVKNMTDW